MAKQSAGLLLWRTRDGRVEVFLVHPGGPLWAGKDEWSIPKGEFPDTEAPLDAARREFEEETGGRPEGDFLPLDPVRQPGGKLVIAWAVEGDFDPALLRSNLFSMEWPRGSGRVREFPEVDRGAWFGIAEARGKIFRGQEQLLDQLAEKIL
jgi:predicted NUDIX family NTP pyrophosphohydrolase